MEWNGMILAWKGVVGGRGDSKQADVRSGLDSALISFLLLQLKDHSYALTSETAPLSATASG